MWSGLVLVVSLFLVHAAAGTEVGDKEAQLKSQQSLTLEEIKNRDSREAKKEKIEKKRSKSQVSKKNGGQRKSKGDKKNKENGKRNNNTKIKQANKKRKKDTRKPKNKNKKLNKLKLTKRRKKENKKTEAKSHKRQSCASGVTAACVEAAKTVLVFGNLNFIKKFVRYNRQKNTTDNKKGKKGNFAAPKKHMEDAVAGNMTSLPGCKNESRSDFNSNYALLANCSALIDEKCTPEAADQEKISAMTKCNTEMTKIKNATEDCRKLTKDGAKQCTCWIDLQADVNAIKALSPKCIPNMDTMAKDMKKAKQTCTDTFSLCKKAEDASVRLINDCMNFDVQSMNQSKIAEDAGAKVIGI